MQIMGILLRFAGASAPRRYSTAWRNGTMHVEIVYTDEDARILLEATKGLIKKVASRMDENGDPKA